jgi:predicted nucleotidyltransferase
MARTRQRSVYRDGRWNGRTLREWAPSAVEDVVRAFDPAQVIVFGSVALGSESPDSDLDLLVVFDHVDRSEIVDLMVRIRRAITAPVPCDVIVTDIDELQRQANVNGSLLYLPAHEGKVIHNRASA